ncbi:hypothetical protein [Sandarakinorhabdus sp. DWP1-3-1]|uniref:hypothetical protein n=1 Tax=Sandarakinorhabdus sp. DWP1-3-1 TaxID=2804627 RepID=UPI003CF72DD9
MIGIPDIAVAGIVTTALLFLAAWNGWLRFETLAAGLVGVAAGAFATLNMIGAY